MKEPAKKTMGFWVVLSLIFLLFLRMVVTNIKLSSLIFWEQQLWDHNQFIGGGGVLVMWRHWICSELAGYKS
jgi:hypothetical protein